MRRITLTACGLITLLIVAGCGTIGATKSESNQTSAGAATSPAPTESLIKSYRKSTIAPDWDHLVDRPIEVNVASAQSDGGLSFRPLVTGTAGLPGTGQVGPSSARSEDRFFIMQMGSKPTAGEAIDSRVFVTQSLTTMTQETLRAIATGNAESGEYAMRQTPMGEVLLIAANGSSRALAVSAGVLIDVTGPSVPQDRAISIIDSLLSTARFSSAIAQPSLTGHVAAQAQPSISGHDAAKWCNARKTTPAAQVTREYRTTVGAVKIRRVGPARSPAVGAWRTAPNTQLAYWCELKTGSSYTVLAVTGNQKSLTFITANVPVLKSADGPLIP